MRRAKLRKVHALLERRCRGFLAMLAARLMPGSPPRAFTTSPALLPSGYLRSPRQWCSAPGADDAIRRARPGDRLESLAKILIAGASIAVGAVTAAFLVRRLRTRLPPPELRLSLPGNRRRRPRCCATAAAAWRVALHRRGGIPGGPRALRGGIAGGGGGRE